MEDFVTFWAVPLFVVATFALWLFDRPGWTYRWKVACLSGLASAGLGLLIAQAISHVWVRERPFVTHPSETLHLTAPSHEPSFPSDHAVAAFAIAFTVLLVGSWRVGVLYLLGATAVGLTRVFVGLHYAGVVAGGALVGLVAAVIVFYGGRSRWSPIIAGISRLADPLVAPAWRALDARRRRRRHA